MSWVQSVVDAHKENEAPPKFFYWAALSALSAVVRKNVFLNRHYYKLYPNIYVFLVARSGMKKGVPVTMARTLVEKANATRIISGRNSMPRIIQDLGKAYTLETGGVVKDAQGFLISGELAAFLVKDPDALTVLTDLHDTHAYETHWVNSLKGTGVDKLKSPCLSMLGATNEEHFSEAVPQNAIGGGFIARTFIVFSLERGVLNSLTQAPAKVVNTDLLAEYLKNVAKAQGEFKWTQQAVDSYDKWYYKYMSIDRQDPTGTRNRMGDQVLKAAMLLSLSDDISLIIKESHILEAIRVSCDCEFGMTQVTMGAGRSSLAFQTRLVMRELLTSQGHCVERGKLLQKYWGEFDSFDLSRIAETLAGADAIDIVQAGKVTKYVMKKDAVDLYTRALREIQ